MSNTEEFDLFGRPLWHNLFDLVGVFFEQLRSNASTHFLERFMHELPYSSLL